jgi:hypothetical protein
MVIPGNDGADTLSVKIVSKSGADGESPYYKEGDIKNKLYINLHPSILSWILFYSVVLSLAIASSILMIFILIEFIKDNLDTINFNRPWLIYGLFIVLVVLVSGFIIYVHDKPAKIMTGAEMMIYFDIIFKDPNAVTRVMMIPFIVCALISSAGIMVVNLVANETFNESNLKGLSTKKTEKEKLRRYKDLKDKLHTFGLYAGLLVSTTIVGLGLQKKMLVQQISNVEKIYPPEFIISYGSSFTLFLALIFLPSLIYLKYLRMDHNIQIESKTTEKSWWAIGKETRDEVKIVFAIILPLLTSMVQSIIGS